MSILASPIESPGGASEPWLLIEHYRVLLRKTARRGIACGAAGLLCATLLLAWWLRQPDAGTILARGSSYGRTDYTVLPLAALTACIIVSAICLFLSVRLHRRVMEGDPAHVTRVLRSVRAALLALLYLLITGTILVPTFRAPTGWIVVGVACCTAAAMLLNAIRRTLHAIAPPRASTGNKLGFPVLLAGGENAPELGGTAAHAAAPMKVIPVGEGIAAQPGVADLETMVRGFAAAGLVQYGAALSVLCLVAAERLDWRTIADGTAFERAVIFGLALIGLCAIFWIVWNVLCIGGGLRWRGFVRVAAWASPCVFAYTAVLLFSRFAMEFFTSSDDRYPALDREEFYLLFSSTLLIVYPMLSLVLLTRKSVADLFTRDRSYALSPELTAHG